MAKKFEIDRDRPVQIGVPVKEKESVWDVILGFVCFFGICWVVIALIS